MKTTRITIALLATAALAGTLAGSPASGVPGVPAAQFDPVHGRLGVLP